MRMSGLDPRATTFSAWSSRPILLFTHDLFWKTGIHFERHGIVSGIIIPPHFRQAPALLSCDKYMVRWPGPFGSGFLSPQPPGIVGIGPIARVNPHLGPTKVGPFSFGGVPSFRDTGFRLNLESRSVIESRFRVRAKARPGMTSQMKISAAM